MMASTVCWHPCQPPSRPPGDICKGLIILSGSQDLLLQLCVDSPAATVWFGRIGGGCFGPVLLSALWVVSDPPSQYKPPLGGRNKVSSSSSRHQALFVNWTFADVAKAKDGTLSAIARVGMGAETCCPKVHLRGGGWPELADQVIPSRRNALITTCWDGDTTNGRGTNLIACLG